MFQCSTRVVHKKINLRVWFNCILGMGSGAWRFTVCVAPFGPPAVAVPPRPLLLMIFLCTGSSPSYCHLVVVNNQKLNSCIDVFTNVQTRLIPVTVQGHLRRPEIKNIWMLSRDFLHICTQRNSRPTFNLCKTF